MNTPRSKKGSQASNTKIYLLVGVIIACSVGYAAWPSISNNNGVDTDLLKRLMDENVRLQQENLRGQAPAVQAAAPAAPVAAPACNCEYAERAREDAERSKRSLEREVRDLQAELATAKARAAAAPAAAAAVVPAGGAVLPVASCAHQKLEFLRWQTDPATGRTKTCDFTPENYDNWTKMPPLCDYISIECLGTGNKRAAHVFGFGGPGLMIGIADQMLWEFVFARHQNLKHMVELGTMTGGTSLYFGMTANVRGGEFHSFDRSDNRATESRRGWLPNMNYHITDILTNVEPNDPSTHNKEVVNVLDVGFPVLGLFDNGDKKKETDIYARYMAVGSVLLLHDWEHLDLPRPHWEMSYSMVQNTLQALGFEKRYFDFAEHIGSSTRAFQRVSAGPITQL